MIKKIIVILFPFLCHAQLCQNINFELKSEVETTCFKSTMTMLHDRLGRPYLYVANKEDGITIWDIQNLNQPILIKQIPITLMGNSDAINVSQNDNFLYVALGNIFNNNQQSGFCIINIENPTNAFVVSSYFLPNSTGGSGIVISDGNYAYLGAMSNGLAIFDVSNKESIQLINQFIPQKNWPDENQDLSKVNARGMFLYNNTIYLCYDAGGFRIIDVTQKNNPIEIARYSNPIMNSLPRAYNNVVIENDLAYITVDYCGLEILDISQINNIQLIGWWNPYNCPNNNWFTSPSHANEIKINNVCKQVFLSTGKSDAIVIDVSNPNQPDSCNYFGGVNNEIGTWGIDVYENKMFLSYICTFGIPFSSNWSGFKCISFQNCINEVKNNELNDIYIYPNPVNENLFINTKQKIQSVSIQSIEGKEIFLSNFLNTSDKIINLNHLSKGIYILKFKVNEKNIVYSFIKE